MTGAAGGERVPVAVLTGFLGSGKTTVLARLLRDPAFADTAVVVNEFGEVGLDHVLVEAADETIVDLSCGCVCCTVRGDLIEALSGLHDRRERGELRRFRRAVVETTGLADPAPVLHTLMQDPKLLARYRLARVVAAVDAANAMATLDREPEAVRQAAMADVLLVTKTDIAGDAAALRDRLREINPAAPQVACVHGAVDPAVLFPAAEDWRPAAAAGPPEAGRHGDGVATFVVRRDRPVGRGALAMFLQMLADQKGEGLLRVKGLVALADDPSRPAVVHGVQHVVHPIRRLDAWPEGGGATALVFVVRGVDQDLVERLLDRASSSGYAAVAR